VEALLQIISNSSQDAERLCNMAVRALATICCGDSADIQQRAAGAGAVEALVRLISSSHKTHEQLLAVGALAVICSGDSADIIKQRATGAGAVEALVRLISSSQETDVLRQAARALAAICSGDSADIIKQRAAGAGAVEELVQLSSSSSSDAYLLQQAAGALGNIAMETAQPSSRGLQAQGLWSRWCGSSEAARAQ
jgi:hypothetical protein